MTILHQFDGVPIRVGNPCLARVIHAEGNIRDFYPSAFQCATKFIECCHLQAEMFVTRANVQLLDVSAPYFRCHGLIEKLQKGCVTTGEVISKWLTFLIVQRKFDLQTKFINVEIYNFFEIVRDKVEMCQFSDHK